MNINSHLEDSYNTISSFMVFVRNEMSLGSNEEKKSICPAVQRFFQYSPQKSKELIKSGILTDEDLAQDTTLV